MKRKTTNKETIKKKTSLITGILSSLNDNFDKDQIKSIYSISTAELLAAKNFKSAIFGLYNLQLFFPQKSTASQGASG